MKLQFFTKKTGSDTIGRKFVYTLILILSTFVISFLFADESTWKTGKSSDGKITVRYNISDRKTSSGKTAPLIEYHSTTIENLSLKSCIALMKDASKHKDFTGDDKSEKVGMLSDTEWVIYYFKKNPWPVSDFDYVVIMHISENPAERTARFTMTSAPDAYPKKNINRLECYNMVYSFKELDNSKTEITVDAKMSPPTTKVPHWMISAAFPGAGTDIVKKIVKLARNY